MGPSQWQQERCKLLAAWCCGQQFIESAISLGYSRHKPDPATKPKPALTGGQEHGLLPAPGENLKGAVDVRGIVPSAPTGQAAPPPQPEEVSLGPDFSDEEDVPPLC